MIGLSLRRASGVALFAVSCLAAGCGGGADTAPPVTVRDSSGIRIVENHVQPDAIPTWTISPRPDLRIGVIEGDAAYQFVRIIGAVRLADGGIVVADAGTQELRLFDPVGVHLRTVGGPGGGPGEYRFMRALWLMPGDSLLVYDGGLYRLTLYTSDAGLVRSWPIQAQGQYYSPPILGRLTSGDYVAETAEWDVSPPIGLVNYTTILLRYSPGGQLLDTLAMGPGGQTYSTPCDPGAAMICNVGLPFARTGSRVAAGERLYLGNGETYEIRVFVPGSEITDVWRWMVPIRPVTQSNVDQVREYRLRTARDDNQRRRTERWFSEMPIPETVPAYSSFTLDAEENLWVEDFRAPYEPTVRYTVFDPSGVIVARIEVPPGLEIMDFGPDYVLGVVKDENDVEFVQLHTLSKLLPLKTLQSE